MKKCWDPEPSKRPTAKILEDIISEWLQSSSIMEEFIKTLEKKQANTSVIQSHPQAYYKSRLFEKVIETLDQGEKIVFSSKSDCIILNKSECLECEIKTIPITKK